MSSRAIVYFSVCVHMGLHFFFNLVLVVFDCLSCVLNRVYIILHLIVVVRIWVNHIKFLCRCFRNCKLLCSLSCLYCLALIVVATKLSESCQILIAGVCCLVLCSWSHFYRFAFVAILVWIWVNHIKLLCHCICVLNFVFLIAFILFCTCLSRRSRTSYLNSCSSLLLPLSLSHKLTQYAWYISWIMSIYQVLELGELIKSKKITSLELTQIFIQRLKR